MATLATEPRDSAAWNNRLPADPVLRSEPFSIEHLENYARELAAALQVSPGGGYAHDLIARLGANATFLRKAFKVIATEVAAGEPLTPGAEWLLDNFYIVEEQLREGWEDLPRRYYRELPKLSTGVPRVYVLAVELVAHTDSALDEETIARFVREFQTVAPLTMGEVWAIPIMLRLGLIENLRRLAAELLVTRESRLVARQMAEQIDDMQEEVEQVCGGENGCVVLHLVDALQQQGHDSAHHVRRVERHLADRQTSVHDVVRGEHQRQVTNQISIGNVITSMRLISALDWVNFFERTSLAENALRLDPAGVYPQMDFATRDRYRHVVEELAKGCARSDLEVAQQAVALAQVEDAAASPAWERRHVGYFLVDKGRERLERAVEFRPQLAQRFRRAVRAYPSFFYLGSLASITLGLMVLALLLALGSGASPALAVLLACIFLLPASDLAANLANLAFTRMLAPQPLPKLELKDGVPSTFATMVVIPSMLTSRGEIESLLQRLELHFLANSDEALRFALLTDFSDAPKEQLPTDDDLVAQAVDGIRTLNERYGTPERKPFYLFHRRRQWNAQEGAWMGWERKRGKLLEFNRLVRGQDATSYVVLEGELDAILQPQAAIPVRFVITLDADTRLTYGAARRLIGALAHPLNRPRVAASGDRIERGYVLLQPRLSVSLPSSNRSWYARIFADSPGIDPYSTCASDVYQDLYGEGSFTGKGIYDLATFETILDGAFPDNAILSHDLIEGCHARAALVSDIELVDSYPARYDAESRRQHRWVRGDWQLLPWLLPYVPTAHGWRRNVLSLISYWKVCDNLRRSLVAPALLALFVAAWFFLPAQAWAWTLAGLAVILFPSLVQLPGVVRPGGSVARFGLWRNFSRTLAQCMVSLAFLPYKAWLMVDAIGRTLVRLTITHRRLLEWEAADAAERRLGRRHSLWGQVALLWPGPVVGLLLGVLLAWPANVWAAPVLLLWFASPLLAYELSQPRTRAAGRLGAEAEHWLRYLACKTWGFFEVVVTAGDHWLPPDNAQEYPEFKIAHRVSPTNEGLYLVSALAARDFGFVSLHGLVDRWERNWANWELLERLNGHWYNWYDTETLQALRPRYVSTVDSGNLAVSLLTVRQGMEELEQAIIFSPTLWRGRGDILHIIEEACAEFQQADNQPHSPPLDRLLTALHVLGSESAPAPDSLFAWWPTLVRLERDSHAVAERLTECTGMYGDLGGTIAARVGQLVGWIHGVHTDLQTLHPWIPIYLSGTNSAAEVTNEAPPCLWQPRAGSCSAEWKALWQTLSGLDRLAQIAAEDSPVLQAVKNLRLAVAKCEFSADDRQSIEAWLAELAGAVGAGAKAAGALRERLWQLSDQLEGAALEMDFRFLFNPQRRLFSIGFNIEDGKLDRSHYDLLASEARVASHFAIAKGDVEPRHWFQLGRPVTDTAGEAAVLSWGGTMFEYMMPPLFHHQEEGSLLAQSCQAAVARQIQYGRQHGVPWGISESAFAALAVNSDYHYRSFGVPGLGLKRGLAKDMVVSPYSTLLALDVQPQAAHANLERLREDGGLGGWGFYEAVDYSPERVPAGKRCLVVRCYMAHHHAMSLVSITNYLCSGVMRTRFRSYPLLRAAEILLQERVLSAAPRIQPHADEVETVNVTVTGAEHVLRRLTGVATAAPRTHLLSNGQYSVMLTHTGGSASRCRDLAVTRWRSDVTRDHWGQFIYLRDRQSGRVWSCTYQPTCATPDGYEVSFAIDKAEFRRRDGDLETRLEVAVSPENNTEVRQLTLTNHGAVAREIEITSYAEIVLLEQAADVGHPAFHKLFVQTEYVAEKTALLAQRRPRDAQTAGVWGVHVLAAPPDAAGTIQHETDRQAFVGRGRTTRAPAALDGERQLSGATGAVLDPIFSLRCRVLVRPHESVSVAYALALATSREEALVLADQYHDPRGIQRAFELAWAYSQVELKHLHLSAARAHLYQRLAAGILYPQRFGRAPVDVLLKNRRGQSGLWSYGISGDQPLLLVRVTRPEHVNHVRELMQAQEFWNARGLRVDLAVLNDYPGSYLDALQEQLLSLVQERQIGYGERPLGVYLLRGAQIPQDDLTLLNTAAAVVLHGEHGTVAQQVERMLARSEEEMKTSTQRARDVESTPRPLARFTAAAVARRAAAEATPYENISAASPAGALTFWNGLGGFTPDGREYHLHLEPGKSTPRPWSNVIANERFGCLVTESGGGYTWFANSRENKLTPWCNDPVSDAPGEVLYVSDLDSDTHWSPMTGLLRSRDACQVQHGQGYTRFRHTHGKLQQEVTVALAGDDPVKVVKVTLRNAGQTACRLALTYYVEWVLGVAREQTQLHVATSLDAGSGALMARNAYHPELSGQVAFLRVLADKPSCTGDRTEFIGRNGDLARPTALSGAKLSGRTGAGLDPCGAVRTQLTLAAGETAEIIFLLGSGDNEAHTAELLARYATAAAVNEAVAASLAHWEKLLGTIQISTPNVALNLLVNRWLLYQTLGCRIWARTGYYQASGAFGFRDQLQDVMALVYARPDLARAHLLRAASRQYEEGDVQHWWHPPQGRGTRTRFSDDYLWLPFVVSHYVNTTGDASVLDEVVPFLHSSTLEAHEHERYELPQVSAETGTLYEHCRRTLARSSPRGAHGLPLMGCGDWNDGMNKVGEEGRGESVWVAWFLRDIFRKFVPLMEARGDGVAAAALELEGEALREAIEQAWDGAWYRRAYFDNGVPLGSAENDECQIDSIVQTWAVFVAGNTPRTRQAMQSVRERLVRASDQLVLLFAPPFDRTVLNPGYIKGYLPGIRENGGQYTHPALWVVQAFAQLHDAKQALATLDLINPIHHARTPAEVDRYRVEPYVVAADVYGVAPHEGEGGWSWYTGSAGWMYRVILESILGFERRGDVLYVKPCLPAEWPGFEISYKFGSATYEVSVTRAEFPANALTAEGNGHVQEMAEQAIPLRDDGEVHRISIAAPVRQAIA